MLSYEVLCIGSATADNFLTIEQPFSSIHPGDKILASHTEICTGGGASDLACALATLGLKTKVLSKLGNDNNDEIVARDLERYKVKNICLHHSSQNTDAATIISSTQERDRIIYVHKGASGDLRPTDYRKYQLRAKWWYIASVMGNSLNTVKTLLAHSKGRSVLFNPSLYLAEKGKKDLQSILDATTILVLNKEEAQALLGSLSGSPQVLLRGLHQLGPEIAIITDGPRRLYALHEQQVYTLLPPKVKVVHTAGAGDAFTAGFLAGYIRKYAFEDALRLGQVNASSVIQHLGAKSGLLTEHQAHQAMKKYKILVHQRKIHG